MKNIKIINFLMSFAFIFIIGNCDEGDINDPHDKSNQSNAQFIYKNVISNQPSNIFSHLAIDKYGNVWFTEVRTDTTVQIPAYSDVSAAPLTRIYKYDGINYYVVYDNIKTVFYDIALDKADNIWLMNTKQIMKIDQNHKVSVICTLNDNNSSFQTITVDNDDNIWAGGFNTGIYKIKNNCEIFTTSNSKLPTNSITKIYIDKNNTVWAALWYVEGLLKIDNSWTIYNVLNSQLDQQVRDLVLDNNGNLWIGTGWENPKITALKFDGTKWEVRNPKDETNNDIPGIIYNIICDKYGKIWELSAESKNNTGVKQTLSVFDGTGWKIIKDPTENYWINDMKTSNDKIYMATSLKLYILDSNSF